MEQQDAYPLDDNAISQLAELQEQARAVQTCTQFVLNHFIRQHKLQGVWQLAENGRELVQQRSPSLMQDPQG